MGWRYEIRLQSADKTSKPLATVNVKSDLESLSLVWDRNSVRTVGPNG